MGGDVRNRRTTPGSRENARQSTVHAARWPLGAASRPQRSGAGAGVRTHADRCRRPRVGATPREVAAARWARTLGASSCRSIVETHARSAHLSGVTRPGAQAAVTRIRHRVDTSAAAGDERSRAHPHARPVLANLGPRADRTAAVVRVGLRIDASAAHVDEAGTAHAVRSCAPLGGAALHLASAAVIRIGGRVHAHGSTEHRHPTASGTSARGGRRHARAG